VSGHGNAVTAVAEIWDRPTLVITADVRARMVRNVAGHARDSADLVDLLRVLGLTAAEAAP
jgi:hypothetical protein